MTPSATGTSTTVGGGDAAPTSLQIILDYPDLATPDRRTIFVSALRKAMVGLGFFYLRDSPLEVDKARLFDLAKQFFERPVEERRKIAQEQSRHFRKYSSDRATRSGCE